jgi:hypothetical protein
MPVTVTVEAGDALYIPIGWWHEVTALPAAGPLCCSASFMFTPFFVRLRSRSVAGPLTLNPKYRHLWDRAEVDDEDDSEKECSQKETSSRTPDTTASVTVWQRLQSFSSTRNVFLGLSLGLTFLVFKISPRSR